MLAENDFKTLITIKTGRGDIDLISLAGWIALRARAPLLGSFDPTISRLRSTASSSTNRAAPYLKINLVLVEH